MKNALDGAAARKAAVSFSAARIDKRAAASASLAKPLNKDCDKRPAIGTRAERQATPDLPRHRRRDAARRHTARNGACPPSPEERAQPSRTPQSARLWARTRRSLRRR